VIACRETSGGKYHAAVIDRYTGQIAATKCNYSKISSSGGRRQFYAAGGYINCKRCAAAIRKETGR